MDRATEYLAIAVLNEGQVVTYFTLSRALRIHTHTAKQCLSSFHRTHSPKHSDLHAIYLVSGTRSTSPSTPSSNSDEAIPTTTTALIPSSSLPSTLASFSGQPTVCIYALSPVPNPNPALLSSANARARDPEADPLAQWNTYGTIHNPAAKRRAITAARSLPAATRVAASNPSSTPSLPSKAPAKPKEKPAAKDFFAKSSSGPAKPKPTPTTSSSKPGPAKKPSALAASFAKTPKPAYKNPTAASASASAPATDADGDALMGMSSDEHNSEAEAEAVAPEIVRAQLAAREARAEARRRMFDGEDEEMLDAGSGAGSGTGTGAATPVESPEDVGMDESAPPSKKPDEPEGTECAVVATGGRRRGKRRVVRKVQMEDEEGYLVTREEKAWESFSEDEPVPVVKKRPMPVVVEKGGKKGKKGGGAGQGSITSFFAKK
ncbi:hypothetical protein EJ06DRAFT_585766 [Trichodelitschia bisporula]|uniref:DNA polymerase delta subunit 3 n=1 Tax=Trichodelitschia bisporula TaxID=703511 RepID=A0A6G1HID9_9PEZI|nr:hypothetical protein EJ06DRAFT_585766 [Trichodelitschia bisporula]